MASAKDTFEADTFEAGSFACGTWRGIGVSLAATVLGLEWTLPDNRMHFEMPSNRVHFEMPINTMHFELTEED